MKVYQLQLRHRFLIAMGLSSLGLSMLTACNDKENEDTGEGEVIDPLDVDNDGDGITENSGDCDDTDASVFPGASEVINDGIDQNCDGEDLVDADEDGFVADSDCDDSDASVYPGADEVINDGIDQDCDGEDLVDADEDGFVAAEDCDDDNAMVYPGAEEVCDGVDNDCDGGVDNEATDMLSWYADFDSDTYGDPAFTVMACEAPPHYVLDNTDCDDSSSSMNPGEEEIVDGLDNNCDGMIDEMECTAAPEPVDSAWLQNSIWSGNYGPYMFCLEPPSDGSACATADNVSTWSLIMDTVGPPADNMCEWFAGPNVCGPAASNPEECCYVFNVDLGCIAIGRPLNIDGGVRMAPVCESSEWTREVPGDVSGLSDEQKEILVDGWLKAAREEHASVASFARFTMELMALGAPPELLASATRAQADEISHARSSFAIASKIAGIDYGPGPLDIHGALPEETTIEDVLVQTIFEGCVNETLAAAEADWLAERCQVSSIQKVQKQISQDEARHAGLGWKTVRWILRQRPDLAPMAAAAFTEAKDLLRQLEQEVQEDNWMAAWGRMPSAAGNQLRADIWRTVIQPCAEALLKVSGVKTAVVA